MGNGDCWATESARLLFDKVALLVQASVAGGSATHWVCGKCHSCTPCLKLSLSCLPA